MWLLSNNCFLLLIQFHDQSRKMSEINKLVWAKLGNYPYWPAQVVERPAELSKYSAKKTCVLFFGTKNYGFIQPKNILDYETNRENFMNASNTTKFQDAVKQIEQFFRKPQTLSSDGPVKVKIEADDGNDIQFETIAIAKASKEKKDIYKNLTSEILSLKEANNAMYYDLQKTKESTKLLETENQQLKAVNFSLLEKQKKCQTAEDELNRLKSELGDTKNQLVETKKENKILQARCREFQMGIDQSKQAYKHKEKENQDEQHYEVEEILAHKNHRKGRAYLIRWRGYTSIDDRWVKESDMFCPDILNAYKKSHNLN